MPPQRPARLPPFLGRIARNTALDRYDYNTAQCRGALPAALEELRECVSGAPLEEALDFRALGEAISRLSGHSLPGCPAGLPPAVLVRRQPGGHRPPVRLHHMAKVKSLLHRTRKGLREHLIREGYAL